LSHLFSFFSEVTAFYHLVAASIYGKSPMPRQEEILQSKRLSFEVSLKVEPLTHPTVRPFESLTALRRIEG